MSVSWIEVVSLVILHSIIVMIKQKDTGLEVACINCSYQWTYTKGAPTYRVRCPRCHSAKNDLNRKTFGKWRPFS